MKMRFRFTAALLLCATLFCLASCRTGGDDQSATAHTHAFSDAWNSDGNRHWHTCSICGERDSIGIHTEGADKTCSVCGAQMDPDAGKEQVSVTGVIFSDKSVTYNTQVQNNTNIRGMDKNVRISRYEYYRCLNGTPEAEPISSGKPGDPTCGAVEVGEYLVRAYLSRTGYAENYVEAKLYILQSFRITYQAKNSITGGSISDYDGSEGNPGYYSEADARVELVAPVINGFKFKGWYYQGSPIEEIDTTKQTDLALTAYFQPYLPDPKSFREDADGTQEPTELPALPEFDSLPDNAHKLFDMSRLKTGAWDEEGVNLILYDTPAEYTPAQYRTPVTKNGQTVFQWLDFNDTLSYGEGENAHTPRDGHYCDAVMIRDRSGNTYEAFDTVEFWVYSENATGSTFSVCFFLRDQEGNVSDSMTARYTVTLNFSGWKKFSVSFVDFSIPAGGSLADIGAVRFLASDRTFNNNEDRGTLTLHNSPTNYLYISDIYLTQHPTPYTGKTALQDSAFQALPGLYQNLARRSMLTDEQIAAHLTEAEEIGDATTRLFGYDLTTLFGLDGVYGTLYQMAAAYSDPDSTYYYGNLWGAGEGCDSNRLAHAIRDTLTFLCEHDYFGASVVRDARHGRLNPDDYRSISRNLIKTALLIGDRTRTAHGRVWMAPVLALYQDVSGSGADRMESAFLYAGSNLLAGNKREYLVGLRRIWQMLDECEVTLTVASDATEDVLSLIAISQDTLFAPSEACMSVAAGWFFSAVDSMTFGGRVQVGTPTNLLPYVRAILTVYPMLSEAEQAGVSRAIRGYMEADASLTPALNACTSARVRTLAQQIAKLPAPATESDACYLLQKTGEAVFRCADYFFYVNRDGYAVTTDTAVTLPAGPFDSFAGMAKGGILALAAGNHAIVASADGIRTAEGAIAVRSGDTTVFVAVPGSLERGDYSATQPCVLFGVEDVEFGSIRYTVCNLTGAGTLTLYINGVFDKELLPEDPRITCEQNEYDVTVNITFDGIAGETCVFDLYTAES